MIKKFEDSDLEHTHAVHSTTKGMTKKLCTNR